jgi:hypothetical protein
MDQLNMSADDFIDGIDFDDTVGLDTLDIDNLLNGDGNIGSFNMNDGNEGGFNMADTELLNLMSQHLSPSLLGQETSDSSIDKLVSMPLLDLDGLEPDPFAENLVMNQMQNTVLNMNQVQHKQMQMMAPDQNPGPDMYQPQAQRETQSSTTVEDLEREKLKLLSKLNEINQRQTQINESTSNMMPQGNHQQQQMMMQQMNSVQIHQKKPAPQQQQMASMMHQMGGLPQRHTQKKPSLVSAVAGMSVKDTGESPLTSFLRQKGGASMQGASMHAAGNNKNTSPSVFNEKPVSVDPFNRGSSPNLSGAMDRSTATHAMIKQLSFKTDQNAARSTGRSGDATWGTDSGKSQGYRYSGILPKHASDGHLLLPGLGRGSKNGLSKDTLLYGLGRSKGRTTSQSSLHGLAKKNSSNKLSSSALNKEDFGGAIPRKGRAGAVKYKFGMSGSVGQLGSFGQLISIL